MYRLKLKRLVGVTVALVAHGGVCAFSATLAGTVTGPGGEGLPGATVVAAIEGGKNHHTVVTGEGGEFRITGLAAGSYEVESRLQGFHSTAASGVNVDGDRVARVRLALSTATFHDALQVESATPHASLEASELRESAARDLGEALARMPGVSKVRKGGIANDVVLRGFRQDDITVLIDGARVAGACPNRMDPPAFHLDFAEIDRVEVSPASGRMAAQGSLGGMVNVVTRKPGEGLDANVSMVAGSFGLINPSATVSYGAERWGVLGGYSHRSGEAFADGSGERFTDSADYSAAAQGADAYSVGSGWARLFLVPAEGHELSLSYARQEADGVLYPTLMMDADYDDTDRLALGYRFDADTGGFRQLRATAYATQVAHWMTDAVRMTSASAPRGYGMGTYASTEVFGASVEADIASFVIGVEVYRRNWDAWTEMAGMNYMRQFSIPDVDVSALGLSARWRRTVGAGTDLEIGARIDRVGTSAAESKANTDLYFAYHGIRSTSRIDTEPSFSVRAVHQLSRSLSLSGSVSRTVRAPDPRERYFGLKRMGGDWVGNPGLAPPRATGAELGLAWRAAAGTVTTSAWIDSVSDFIALYGQERINMVPGVMNTQAQSYANVDAVLRGLSVEGTAALSQRVFLSGNLSYLRGSKDARPELGITSDELAEMPPLTARLAVRWQNPKFFGEIEGLGATEQHRVDADLNEEATDGWSILNLKAGATLGRWRLQLILENALDRSYREHFSYLRNPFRSGFRLNEPGRSLSATIGWRM